MSINSEVIQVKVNGVQVPVVDGSFNFALGGKERTAVMGTGRLLGYTEANVPAECSFDVANESGVDPTDLDAPSGGPTDQVSITWDQGAQWLLTRVASVTPTSGTAGSGVRTVSYQGHRWEAVKV